MFTGIVEELGIIQNIESSSNSMKLVIGANLILHDVKLGDSIAVNGACLTVTEFSSKRFKADVMPETFSTTSLKQLKIGDSVNLERALQANERFGGHIVSGHIDGLAKIMHKGVRANAVYVDLEMSEELLNYCVEKGSITVDGISLTLFKVTSSKATVSLIPHTYKHTVLGIKKVGEVVNIELDMMSKYVEKHVLRLLGKDKRAPEKLTMDLLQRAGF